jgi:hypothetical protein
MLIVSEDSVAPSLFAIGVMALPAVVVVVSIV